MALSFLPVGATLCFGVERAWTPGKGIAEGRDMEAGSVLSWTGTGEQFEGLSPLGPAFLKKPWKNWPGTINQEQSAATN